ncbi:CDP-alcohol phosphatidyltransferase family protein [Pararhizobium mangrovi]|uniref:CDP-alcohol phosphatidyltransferase family protein n=2 Tax=Pararhizobium mangrovi TaxID=2590452 RepID=A0A506UA94_9HYPH|nr:CDP-alcohol phosphatidyltransferase family protein [Pararhizobium mangrovi]
MTSRERLRRSLALVGVETVDGANEARGRPVVLLRGDWIFDQRLVAALVDSPQTLLVADDGSAVAAHVDAAAAGNVADALAEERAMPEGLTRKTPATLAGAYENKLRKREPAFLMRLTPESADAIRARTFRGSYKGVTDFVTKHVWPRPAQLVTGWCARFGISPNQVTWASLVLVLLAFALFWTGHYAVGLVAAWIMTFLDTVDGKLARVTLTYSKAGDVLDHGIDLVHPPFWWWAWIVGLPAAGFSLAAPGWTLAVIVIGYVAQRLEEGAFLALFGIEMHIWRRFDSWFRGITARRNPNLVILTVLSLFGRPDIGIVLVAIWTALCFLVHLAQILQASVARRREPIRSWLAA